MKGFHRTRRALLAGALAIGGAAVFSAAAPATADEHEPVVINQPYGILRLQITSSVRKVTFTPAPGVNATAATQTISVNNKCGISTNGSLLTISQTGGSQDVGVEGTNLGVRSKNNCATDSGRVNGPETLTVALSSGKFPAGVVVSSAELDIEGKKNSNLGYVLDPGPHQTAGEVTLGHATSDNGPDSGIGDNDRAIIPGPFRSIRLTPTGSGGEISLNGGGDGTVEQYANATPESLLGPKGAELGTADSIFVLSTLQTFEQALFCNDEPLAATIGGAASSATVERFSNDGDPEDSECDDIGVTFEILDDAVLLEKSTIGVNTGQEQDLNAQVTINWAPFEPGPTPWREINFTPDNSATWEPVEWCESQDAAGNWEHPVKPWCLVSDYAVLNDEGEVVQIQVYAGSGDPMWR